MNEVEFLDNVLKGLVAGKDCYTIDRSVDEKGVLLLVKVDNDNMGRVIGRGGETAKAIRTLLRTLAALNNARYNLKIEDRDQAAA